MLLQRLQEIIPNPHNEFPKLTGKGNPYVFVRCNLDYNNDDCIYFEFPSKDGKGLNEKRVVIKELEGLLINRLEADILFFDRDIFKLNCPNSHKQGTCGYAVTIRMFEYLKIAEYLGAQGCNLFNPQLIREILG